MGKKDFDTEFDKLLRAAVQTEDEPPVQLNNTIKAELYERERLQRSRQTGRSVSVWYLPMVLNLVVFAMLGAAAVLLSADPYVTALAVGGCAHMGLAGVIITVIGVKRANLREDIAINIQKGASVYDIQRG